MTQNPTTSWRKRAPGIALIVAAAIFSVVPLLSMLSASLAAPGSIPSGLTFTLHPHWSNFVSAWNIANITTLLKSSLLIVAGVVPIGVLISTMAAYAIYTLEVPFGKVFYTILLLTLTLPFELVIVPLWEQDKSFGLLGTKWALILPLIGLNMPFAVFWMSAHFKSVPKELVEASLVDGARPWRALRSIHIPLASSAIASLALLMFLSTWNQFLLPLVLIGKPNSGTMAEALQAFVTRYGTNDVLLNAGALEIMAPTIVVFIILQRHFVKALLQGAVKG